MLVLFNAVIYSSVADSWWRYCILLCLARTMISNNQYLLSLKNDDALYVVAFSLFESRIGQNLARSRIMVMVSFAYGRLSTVATCKRSLLLFPTDRGKLHVSWYKSTLEIAKTIYLLTFDSKTEVGIGIGDRGASDALDDSSVIIVLVRVFVLLIFTTSTLYKLQYK